MSSVQDDLGVEMDCFSCRYRVPWDLRMVSTYHLYLPRVSYEYSGLKQPLEPPKRMGEIDFTELYVEKAYRGMFQRTLSDSNVYGQLRNIRTLIYQALRRQSDSESYVQVVEILRCGNTLEVASAVACGPDERGGMDVEEDSPLRFFHHLLLQPMSAFLMQDVVRCGTTDMSGCADCKRVFHARCLQLRILVRLLEVVFEAGSHEDIPPNCNCYSFQVSLVLLAARHLCRELTLLPCLCFKTCRFLSDGVSESFPGIPLAQDDGSRVLTDFQLTNLWSAVEVSVLHCEYLMFCVWSNSSSDTAHLSPEESHDVTSKLAREMQFPFSSLSPSLFAGVHRQVVLSGKSSGVSSFVARCVEGYADCDDLFETKAKVVFKSFVKVVMPHIVAPH